MEEIEAFVRKLCAEGDLSVLSKKLIRTQYQASYNKDSLTREEKDKINEVLEAVIQELADQTKDTAVHTNVGGNVNTSSADQGKENLHSDLTCASSTSPPPLLKEEKVAQKLVRPELGSSFLGHNHLRRFQLLMNHGGRKSGNVRIPRNTHTSAEDAAAATNGPVSYQQPPTKGVLLKRTSKESVSHQEEGKLLSQGEGPCVDGNSGSRKIELECAEPTATSCIKQSSSAHTSVESGPSGSKLDNKNAAKVTKADSNWEASEDDILLLLPGGSAAGVSVAEGRTGTGRVVPSKQKMLSRFRGNRNGTDIEKCTPTGSKDVPSGSSPRQKQRMASKKVSLQTVLSAVLQSAESENSSHVAGCKSASCSKNKPPSSYPSRVSQSSSKITPSSGGPPEFFHSPEVSRPSAASLSSSVVPQQSTPLQSSPDLSQFSSRVSHFSSDSGDGAESKVPNIYTQLKVKINLVKPAADASKKSAASKSESSCQWSIDRKLESGRQSQCISAIDDTSEMSRADESEEFSSPLMGPIKVLLPTAQAGESGWHPKSQKRLRCNRKLFRPGKETESDSHTDDPAVEKSKGKLSVNRGDNFKDVSHSGFSSTSFFRKKSPRTKTAQRVVSDKHKPKQKSVDAESDISQESVLESQTSRHSFYEQKCQTLKEKSDYDLFCQLTGKERSMPVGNVQAVYKRHTKLKRGKYEGATRKVRKHKDRTKLKQRKERGGQIDLKEQIYPVSDESDLDDLPLNLLRHVDTKGNKCALVVSDTGSDETHMLEAAPLTSSKQKPTLGQSGKEAVQVSSACGTGKTGITIRLPPFSLSPPISPVVKKSVKQHQRSKRAFVNVDLNKNSAAWERSVYSLSESTGEEEHFNQIFRKKFKLQKMAGGTEKTAADMPLAQRWSVYSLSESTSSDAVSLDGKFIACRKPGDKQSKLRLESDEPWKSIVYRGERLMFPVIKLTDITRTLPTMDGKTVHITSTPRKERNVFDFFQSATSAEEESVKCSDDLKAENGSSETLPGFSESLLRREKSADSAEHSDNIGLSLAVTLEASRSELKKQRTVKRITPKLCLNLKLRKQPSPNKSKSSSEVEEWTVVNEEEDSDCMSQCHLFEATCMKENLRQSSCFGKKSKSKKRKTLSSDEDDQPLKKKRPVPLADRSDDDVSDASDKECEDEDTPIKVKKLKKKKRNVQLDISDEDEVSPEYVSADENEYPLKLNAPLVKTTPLKKKKSSKKKKKTSVPSSDEDDQPLKKSRSLPSAGLPDSDAVDTSISQCEEDTPVKAKVAKKRSVVQCISSSDEDDLPLKPRSVDSKSREAVEENGQQGVDVSGSDGDDDHDSSSPLKTKPAASRNRSDVEQDEDGEGEEPASPIPFHHQAGTEQAESMSESEGDEEDATPLKAKKSSTAAVVESSDENSSPSKARVKNPRDHPEESGLDTSSLSSDGEIEAPVKRAGSKSKASQRKSQAVEVGQKKSKKNTGKSSKSSKEPSKENEEAPYLKRLRLICRKVGIFVRNNVHFVGCTTDNEKIERLKEALRKAGMKGQPSLSKVDSVNLKKEAEALDTTNIIESAGRPKRKPKDVFSRTDSPKKSLTPIKQAFSRIKDLISDSESD